MFNLARSSSTNKKSVFETKPTMKIEDFPQIFSGKIIALIVREEKETHRKYFGGNFHINYIDSENYSCSYELYSRTIQMKFIRPSKKVSR